MQTTLNDTDAVKALAALAQGNRLAVFRLLVVAGPEGLSVGNIAETLGLANATLSFHLKELANAGLISSRQEGRYIYYAASIDKMNALVGFLTENCCQGVPGLCEPASSRKC
ncbi:ArsR/SmtB family transcription factor [Pandoraea bronchicola]|uniref:ArsR family transcriptional regulator n=1 Tax=Pandoraea bronchicola TaxID=2508287 RepID=A0A5E5BPT6_9BURK|nr:metalloregulator ArsR/SmtB family transcription factor [Pandoraea bronchicola]VVE87075.1 ArsR family transcriptional regulator [Pandoraea bronchicola]